MELKPIHHNFGEHGEHLHIQDKEAMEAHRKQFVPFAGAFQLILLVLFGALTTYSDEGRANSAGIDSAVDSVQGSVNKLYPFYQDVHVMIFIGFGFLMTFLKKYTFGAVGFNFLLAAFAIQFSLIWSGLVHNFHDGSDHRIELGIENLITSDFAAAAVLITFGAVLGKLSPLQMVIALIIELIVFSVNELIGATILGAVDMGGSMFVHTYGAYFGLALSWVVSKPWRNADGTVETHTETHPHNGSTQMSDMFSILGTIFLWMYWPSFNGALAGEAQQHRVIVNTVLALCASCCMSFIIDCYFRPNHKFDMVSIQNATLAGGVAVGSSSDLIIQPWGAILIGSIAGVASVCGYIFLQPYLARRFDLDDTCGVHNLHGIPGIIGGIGGAISAAFAEETEYGVSVGFIFPRRAPEMPTDEQIALGLEPGDGLTASEQAGIQFAALAITLLLSISAGIIAGIVVKHPIFLPPRPDGGKDHPSLCTIGKAIHHDYFYHDQHYWAGCEDSDEETEATTTAGIRSSEIELQTVVDNFNKGMLSLEDKERQLENLLSKMKQKEFNQAVRRSEKDKGIDPGFSQTSDLVPRDVSSHHSRGSRSNHGHSGSNHGRSGATKDN